MGILNRLRRRKNNRRKPRSCRYERRLALEHLEDRVVLSGDPTLVFVTHGFQMPNLLASGLPQWSIDTKQVIDDYLKDNLTSPFEVVAINWADSSNNFGPQARDSAVQEIVEIIDPYLQSNPSVDLFFVGHSRGAIVNSEAIARLSGQGGIDELWNVMIDPTAWKRAGDSSPEPISRM